MDSGPLLDTFLEQYARPGGEERYFYTLDPLFDFLVDVDQGSIENISVSADVASDLIVGWRRPSRVILYLKQLEDFSPKRVVPATGRSDSNVWVRVTPDRSVFCCIDHRIETGGRSIRIAEHIQILWDLLQMGGEDRQEEARLLREWILSR